MIKKNLVPFLMLLAACASAQTITVNGNVTNKDSDPVPFAFIRDVNHNYATYSDSTGRFRIKADPLSDLMASAEGFKNADIKIGNNTNVKIVMEAGVRAAVTSGSLTDSQDNGLIAWSEKPAILHGQSEGDKQTIIQQGFNKEDVQGSPYLFDRWLPGFGINAAGKLVQIEGYRYNYDKLSGSLVFMKDKNTTMQIDEKKIKSFSLFDNRGSEHVFENEPIVSKADFIEVLSEGSKYKIYKITTTRLIPANFKTNGIITTGQKYDEYQDKAEYYVLKSPGDRPSQFFLKKKSLKEKFGAEADPAISSLTSGNIDDAYLKSLGDLLNR